MKTRVIVVSAILLIAGCLSWFYWHLIAFGFLRLIGLPVLSTNLPFNTMCTVFSAGLVIGVIRVGVCLMGRQRFVKRLSWVLLFALALLGFSFGTSIIVRASHRERYAQFLAIHTRNGIDEGMYVPIGATEQWIQIRGEDRNNPVLLFVHGGEGASTLPLSSGWRPWEKYFTVVQWDQRGAGRSLHRTGISIAPTMTIDQMAMDGIEVTEFLRIHLHQDKIVLVGHSWGSLLGVHMIKMRPEFFSAYVGTGQFVGPSTIEASWEMRKGESARAGDNPNASTLNRANEVTVSIVSGNWGTV